MAVISATPNGKPRRWDKWANEGVRFVLVLILALGGAYIALGRDHHVLFDKSERSCVAIQNLADNQRAVLLAQLALIDVLNDRYKAGLEPIPGALREATLASLANLPDPYVCKE